MNEFFFKIALWTSHQAGRVSTFIIAIVVILIWAVTGPLFHFSDTWQLIINTGTTIITFLMVFLIQNTQNRDTQAIQIKLDELIRVTTEARNNLINLEDASEDTIEEAKQEFSRLKDEAIDERLGGMADDLNRSKKDLEEIKKSVTKVDPR